ncbi:hypothetical protein [Fluviicola taffensis]|uniref:Uncharacterized protein n=1 Tax=Fluviicola taffensis (strain DSM 16823 / NCIMB 13979 / RW262) TaxID=755732 RepID=F2ICC9_FLUTR|nr:hypothetical protein [Fluviicola taffensis]AEA44375.1 hypothetical protein Fluta_2389 [Fluviicola taffensis DSM 16823]
MRKFIPWIVLFAILLSVVPALLIYQQLVSAKVVGVILILIVTVALRIWLRNALKKKLSNDGVKFNVNHRYYLNEISPIYRLMSKSEKKILEKRMGKLIADLQFDDTTRDQLNVDDMLSYALLQILTVYNESYKSLKGKMIVFDQTNNSGELKISDGKFILINPTLLQNTLKNTSTIESLLVSKQPIIEQLKALYYNN